MSGDTERKAATEMGKLMQAYVLGTFLDDAGYKDTIPDAPRDWIITAKVDERAKLLDKWAACMFKDMPETAKIRLLFADIAVWSLNGKFWEKNKNTLPEQFVRDAAADLAAGFWTYHHIKNPFDSSVECCRHHCHGDEPCYEATAMGNEDLV